MSKTANQTTQRDDPHWIQLAYVPMPTIESKEQALAWLAGPLSKWLGVVEQLAHTGHSAAKIASSITHDTHQIIEFAVATAQQGSAPPLDFKPVYNPEWIVDAIGCLMADAEDGEIEGTDLAAVLTLFDALQWVYRNEQEAA